MSRALFEAREEVVTRELNASIEAAERGKLPPEASLDFAARARELALLLSLARHRRYDQARVARLNAMAVRAHAVLHRARARRAFQEGLGTLLHDFPRAVRALPRSLLVGALCFFGSYLAVFAWIMADHGAAYTVLPAGQLESMAEMYDPSGTVQSSARGITDDLTMFGFYIYNNVGIAFRTFGSGLFLGVGSVFVLLFNGVVIGGSHAYVVTRGFGEPFHAFVVGHAGFELFAIVLSGVAGIYVGTAMLAPGRRSRRAALVARAHEVRPILWGSFAMLVIAAGIEAFFSPRDLPLAVKLSVGGALALGLLLFFAFAGRPRAGR